MKLVYTETELMSNHDYAKPHVIGGRRMHGGFDANGTYVPPRARLRNEALDAWTAALRQRGGDLFGADASLLTGARMPNVDQQRLLIRNGLPQTFWNGLTTTGKIEGRGRAIADIKFPPSAEDHQRRHIADVDRPPEQGSAYGPWARRRR